MNVQKGKKHLMLDLDETLICSSPMYTNLTKINVLVKHEGKTILSLPNLVMRPYLMEFLKGVQPHYNIHLFTAAEEKYAEAVLNRLGVRGMFCDVYARSSCENFFGAHIKNLSSLPYPPSETILIDDMTHQVLNQPDQAILIQPFYGDAEDKELKKLLPFLVELSKCADIRPVAHKHLQYMQTGTIPKTVKANLYQRQNSQKARATSNSPQKRGSLQNKRKESKDKASKEDNKKSFYRSSSVVNQKISGLKAKKIECSNEMTTKKGDALFLTAPIKMKVLESNGAKKIEQDSDSDSSEDCNLDSEDEMMAPSDNPSVTRHLGSRSLKTAFLCSALS